MQPDWLERVPAGTAEEQHMYPTLYYICTYLHSFLCDPFDTIVFPSCIYYRHRDYYLLSMSFFSLIQKKGSKPIPPAPNSIRKEIVHSSSNAKKASFLNIARPNPAIPGSRRKGQKATKDRNRPTTSDHVRKRKKSQQTRLVSDSDSGESDTPAEAPKKRTKVINGARKSMKRQLRSVTAFSEDDHGIFPMVHASDIAALDKPTKYRLAFPQQGDQQAVQLQYPSASQQET